MYLVDEESSNYKKFIEAGRPIMLTSFGNVDLLPHVQAYMEEQLGELERAKIELDLVGKFH